MMFSLSYEQMTQMAEEEIKQCDFRRDGTHYVWEVNKAHDILRFWYLLALLVVSHDEAFLAGLKLTHELVWEETGWRCESL